MEFTPTTEEVRRYFEYRLPLEKLPRTDQAMVRCPFHADDNPSLSVNLRLGVWNCKACFEHGGIYEFERKMLPGPSEEVWVRIYKAMGKEMPKQDRRVERIYDYTDESGRLLYQKLRWQPKSFTQRQPDGKGGWINHLQGVRRVLYRLPELIVARTCFVVEGERDVDNLRDALREAGVKDVAVTTCFGGCGGWREEYAPYFAGRLVAVLRDNDDPGRAFQQSVCESVKPYAARVKAIELPAVPHKGDVSDWLEAGHTVAELMEVVKRAPLWKPIEGAHEVLEEAYDLMDRAAEDMDWLVEGMIPVRTRGLMLGGPKEGKSPLSLDLALALATGGVFLGHRVPEIRRVAVVSREDAPSETGRRMKMMKAGDTSRNGLKRGQIWFNTMAQSDLMHLDNDEHLRSLIRELRMEKFDLVIFDVLRELHTQDENDNTAIANTVLAATKKIQLECGCAVLVLHHVRKDQGINVFRSGRGATAIHGWTEWGIGLSIVDESQPRREWVRKVDFELKYACPADPVYFKITGDASVLRIELTQRPDEPAQKTNVRQMIVPSRMPYREDA